ncbi:MAG: SDR family oxidoreductase [Opitutales bacterium]
MLVVNVAVFGASGMLGSAFCRASVRRGFNTLAFSNRRPVEVEGVSSAERLDLNDLQGLERPLLDGWPQLIVNAAAVSDYEGRNEDCAAAARINVDLPFRLAEISNHVGARFLHLSSDMVFDGTSPPYRSTDVPNPLTVYGKQKLEAERKVLQACPENLVVLRITLVNGNSPSGRRSVHEQLLRSLSKGERPILFEDEYRQPCSCENVADVLVDLCERPNLTGLFHWGGAERLSRYEMGCRILRRFALPEDLIEPGSRNDFSGEGIRPSDLAFNLSPLDGKLKTKPATFVEQLEEIAIPDALYEWFKDNSSDHTSYLRRFTIDRS